MESYKNPWFQTTNFYPSESPSGLSLLSTQSHLPWSTLMTLLDNYDMCIANIYIYIYIYVLKYTYIHVQIDKMCIIYIVIYMYIYIYNSINESINQQSYRYIIAKKTHQ